MRMLAIHRTGDFGNVLVAGAGKTGLSCIAYLQGRAARLCLVDSRDNPPGFARLAEQYPSLPLHGGFDPDLLREVDTLVLSPGISRQDPFIEAALQAGIEVIGDVELFARACTAPVIAITGANGKSTVTSLLAEMGRAAGLRIEAGANLGEPALELLARPRPDFFLLELSSFQLESLFSLRPQAAALLNISPDHMDRYASFDHYVAAKMRILSGAGTVVLNRDDPRYQECKAALQPGQVLRTIGWSEPRDEGEYGMVGTPHGVLLQRGGVVLVASEELRLVGRHNWLNVLAAFALAEAMGLSRQRAAAAAREFSGLPHRMQLVGRWRGIGWLDDSKATNAAASLAAIESLAFGRDRGSIVLIAGGLAKGQDFTTFAEQAAEHLRAVILIGKERAQLAVAFTRSMAAERIFSPVDGTMATAVTLAAALARPGDDVLLAPACSSLDQYQDFTERGRDFQRLVHDLVASAADRGEGL